LRRRRKDRFVFSPARCSPGFAVSARDLQRAPSRRPRQSEAQAVKNSRSQGANGIDGTELAHTDSGSGDAVLFLPSAQKSALADRLAQDFRLVTFDLPDGKPQRNLAEAIGQTARQLGIAKYCLIAESELAELAIAHATRSGDSVEALILLAPA